MEKICRLFLALCCLITLSCQQKKEQFVPLKYEVVVSGVDDADLLDDIKKISEIISSKGELNLESLGALQSVWESDKRRITTYLNSIGYYDARVFFREEKIGKNDYKISFVVVLGEAYHINTIVLYLNGEEIDVPKETLKISKQDIVTNKEVIASKESILYYLRSNGHANVKSATEEVEVNHSGLFVTVNFRFVASAAGKFGKYEIKGAKKTNIKFIEKFLYWKEGEVFDIGKVDKSETDLLGTGLFKIVTITSKDMQEDGSYPLEIFLEEDDLRFASIGGYLGASLDSSQKWEGGVNLEWGHDSVFGNAEKFSVSSTLSNLEQDIFFHFDVPYFPLHNSKVYTVAGYEAKKALAYEKKGGEFLSGVVADFMDKRFSCDVGVGVEIFSTKPLTNHPEGDYSLLSIPLSVKIDTRDNRISTTKGFFLSSLWKPYFGKVNKDRGMNYIELKSSVYMPVIKDFFGVSGWAYYSTMLGTSFANIPYDKRRYMGGAKSIRGYSANSLGQKEKLKTAMGDNDKVIVTAQAEEDLKKGESKAKDEEVAVGGQSGVEFGIEGRVRVYGKFWVAGFLEGGHLSQTKNPFNFKNAKDLDWGWGVSFYYFTDFGPFRIDLALPVVDRPYSFREDLKFYLSFGQAY